MKGKRVLLFPIIGILILVLSAFALAGTELSVYPAEKDVAQDELFLISVNIDTTESVTGAQFDIIFDPLVIKALSTVEGGFLTKDGDILTFNSIEINNTLGKIEVVLMKDNTYTGVTGTGSIVDITFKALVKNDVSGIDLENIVIPDTMVSTTDISSINNGTVNVITIEPIVINEIMQNPNVVSDANGEYIELYNPNDYGVDINGWTIQDLGSDEHTIDDDGSLIINAGGYLVLCRNDNILENGGFVCDYKYSPFTLGNTDDEVILLNEGGFEVDRVEYDGGPNFPDPDGASMELKDPSLDNNVGSNWAVSTAVFGDGDKGTPGSVNSFTFGNSTLKLKQGWNLISIPLLLENMSVKSIFEDINYNKIFTYTNNKWQELDNNSLINETIGLWIKILNNDNLELEGTEIENPAFNLKEGWNLIGYPYLEEKDISKIFDDSIVYSYNGSWSSYVPDKTFNSLQTLKPGYGYWVKK